MKVLIVDDIQYFRRKVREGLIAAFGDMQIVEAGTLMAAKTAVRATDFDIILLDLDLSATAGRTDTCSEGLELISYIADNDIKMPHIVVVSGKVYTADAVLRVAQYGIKKVIQKPYKIGDIEQAVRDYMLSRSLK